MVQFSSETELQNYLVSLHNDETGELPDWAELEPGSFIHEVKAIWEKDRDGRRGHITEARIAEKISEITNKKFTRNQYQSMFGAGRKDQKNKTEIPYDICEAFLKVAFSHWSFDHQAGEINDEEHYLSILQYKNVGIEPVIRKLTYLIFEPDLPVRCIPSPGLGPRGFYTKCRKEDRAIIIATEREPIILDDPGEGLIGWVDLITNLFIREKSDAPPPLHIWTIHEPLITLDPRSINRLNGIGTLRTAFLVARALCLGDQLGISWEKFSENCVIVMFLEKNNNKYRKVAPEVHTESDTPILDNFIFPREIPWQWRSRENGDLSQSDLNFITSVYDTVGKDLKIRYNIFLHPENHHIPPVVSKQSPSDDSDKSFENLYRASRYYIRSSASDIGDDIIYQTSRAHGWKFMSADEFLNLKIP